MSCQIPLSKKKSENFEEFTQPPTHTFLCPTYVVYEEFTRPLYSLSSSSLSSSSSFVSACFAFFLGLVLELLAALDFRLVPFPPLPFVFFPVVTCVMMSASHSKACRALSCCHPLAHFPLKHKTQQCG